MTHAAGFQLWTPGGPSTVTPCMDFETYSEAGYLWDDEAQRWRPLRGLKDTSIAAVGAHIYAAHPSTEVLCLSYDLKDGQGVRRWAYWMDDPEDLLAHVRAGRRIESWNSSFEFLIWHHVMRRRGWPELKLEQTSCAMAKARAYGLPGGLADAGRVLGLATQKDARGSALIKRFCCPRQPSKKDDRRRIRPHEDPAGFGELMDYCDQDVRAESAVSEVVPDLSPEMRRVWIVDQEINHRGVHVDAAGVDACISIIEQAAQKYTRELPALTGGVVQTPSQVAAMLAWLHTRGVHPESLDSDTVDALLEKPEALPPDVLRVLEIRALLSAGSVKKLYALRARIGEGDRVRGLFIFHKARTGRYAGEGPQPQNLPSSGPNWGGEWGFQQAEAALAVIRQRRLDLVEMLCGPALATVAGCLRALFTAAPGYDLLCSDYRAIEAVVLAALAGEEWRLEVFRTHGLIYETSAAKIMGVTVEDFIQYKREHGTHHPMRKKLGKVAELASGYRGWVGAWKAFGADEFFSEQEIKGHVLAWRAASPNIVEFWGGQSRGWGRDAVREYYGIEGAAISAILQPGTAYEYRGHVFQMSGGALFLRLLSGRVLVYHRAMVEPNDRGELSISFETWNTNPKYGPRGWVRLQTHGGKLTENIVQATSFDILAHAQVALREQGFATVLHVHDENAAEVPEGSGNVADYEAILGALPEFARGWPVIAAGGWIGKAYRKD